MRRFHMLMTAAALGTAIPMTACESSPKYTPVSDAATAEAAPLTEAEVGDTEATTHIATIDAAEGETDTIIEVTEVTVPVATINERCPVGLEAIQPSSPRITYKGHIVGFCCTACQQEFMTWDASARDRWVMAATRDPGATP